MFCLVAAVDFYVVFGEHAIVMHDHTLSTYIYTDMISDLTVFFHIGMSSLGHLRPRKHKNILPLKCCLVQTD